MATTGMIVVMMMLFVQVICAPQGKSTKNVIVNNFKSPANMSYNDLVYILQVRGGYEVRVPKSLSPCARAILGCCKDEVINEYCSEALGCGAFFFDDNPCEDIFIIDALNAARAFYEQFNSVTT